MNPVVLADNRCMDCLKPILKVSTRCRKCAQGTPTARARKKEVLLGNNIWSGRKHSEQTKRKIADAIKEYCADESVKIKKSLRMSGKNNPQYGKPISEERKREQSLSMTGKNTWRKGCLLTEEHKRKIGIASSGDKCPWWKGGLTKDKVHQTERKRINWEKRRAIKSAAGGSFSASEWKTIKKEYKGTCPACLRDESHVTLSIDHIVPLSKGGAHSRGNIQPLCRSCNSKKGTKLIRYPKP